MTDRAALSALIAAPGEPAKVLISGGIGAGKTLALTEIRESLRDAGVAVLSQPPQSLEGPSTAVVIDDAHLLGDDELRRLTALVAVADVTLVIACQPLAHRAALTELTTAMARERPPVELGPLAGRDAVRRAAELLGAVPPPELGRALLAATAGLPFLLSPFVSAVRDGDGTATAAVHAARVALIERLTKVDEAVLDTLLLCSLSQELGPDDVAAALRRDGATGTALVDKARATGLLSPALNAAFTRGLHRILAQLVGTARHHEVEAALLHSQLDMSTLSTDLALKLAEHGMRDDALADALATMASRSGTDPAQTARLYRAAAEAGATALTAQLADALAMTGDCATAGRLADDLLSSPDEAQRAVAVRVSASIAMHDGAATQAADLFRWLGSQSETVPADVASASAVVAIATGDVAAARAGLAGAPTGPPTSSARAARSLADGLLMTLDQPYDVAMARLAQSVTAQPPTCVMPDSPAALVTLAALHGGDPMRAGSVIGRTPRATGDGAGFFTHRHRLLRGWTYMLDGQLTAANADATAVAEAALHRRDALWASALQAAIARRSGDTGAVQKHWYAGVEVLAEHGVDLYSLLPLGELWIAAARMQQTERLQHALEAAFALLDAVNGPVLWSVPLHWAGVHAGIAANDPGAVAPHGQALTAAAARSPFAKALANAGRSWLRVLANHVDVDEVTTAARGLARFGLTWDATRLASQAALQTPDGRVSRVMLQLARDLKLNATSVDAEVAEPSRTDSAPARTPPTAAVQPPFSRLSDREREVAELLLQGMQYRDIGLQLSISAKTVEHHVARIRRRLGAESRTELMSMLRAILA